MLGVRYKCSAKRICQGDFKIRSLSCAFLISSLGFLGACREKAARADLKEEDKIVQETYQNPVINRDFPDPTVLQAPDDYYYVYATNSGVDGETVNIQVQRSKNLVTWENLPDALPEKPDWANSDFWAPHVLYDQTSEEYLLYYSGESIDPESGKCIGVAVSEKPEGPYVDIGKPLICGENFINIDPMVFVDPASQRKYMYWGSGHESIKVRELSGDGLGFKADSEEVELVQPKFSDTPSSYEDLVEGVWVTYRNGYYFLFYSGDNCCGDQAHYAVMVARSRYPMGPYEKFLNADGNSVILERNEKWIAPGHNSVIQDNAGNFWMVYHAIDVNDRDLGRKMLIDKISWIDDWPVVETFSPSTGKKRVPAHE